MAEYIERDALLERAEYDNNYRLIIPVEAIKAAPTANVVPVVHGWWVEYPSTHYYKCSECRYTVPYKKAVLVNGTRKYNWCPHCGARMDGCIDHEVD